MPLTNPVQFSCKFEESQLFSRSRKTLIFLPFTNPVQFSCKYEECSFRDKIRIVCTCARGESLGPYEMPEVQLP